MIDKCTYCKTITDIYIEFIENEPCCKDCHDDLYLEHQELTKTER